MKKKQRLPTLLSFLTSEGFPLFRLFFLKRRDWYYFADASPESVTLAGQILQSEPNAVIIYGLSKKQIAETPDYPCLFINASLETFECLTTSSKRQ